jgi:DNA invertase Pin-like site-specific DNA recombinase
MSKYFIYCRKSSESEDRQALSIEAQVKELTQRYVEQERLEVVEILQESFSAKKPGRPVFNAMVKRIQKGEANGIIAWHPDRLARNSLDGGKIIYLLDNGKLQDLKFPTYNLENTPQGKFMLAVMFGQSKYYVDSLSENVKRGNRLKLNKGWLPGLPPLGYLNEP